MPDEQFIIVGSDGQEYQFEPGMDHQRAIQAVRNIELQRANAKPLHEPSTYEGGYNKSLTDTATRTGRGILTGLKSLFTPDKGMTKEEMDAKIAAEGTPRLDPMGFGRRVISGLKQTASDMTEPEKGGETIGQLLGVGVMGRVGDAASKVTRGNVAGAIRTIAHPKQALDRAADYIETPRSTPARDADMMLQRGGTTKTTAAQPVVDNSADAWDRYGRAPAEGKPVGRVVGKTPKIEDVLQSILEDAMVPEEPTKTTAASEMPTAGEGSFKQSWPKSKQQNLGGYSSGRPAVTDTRMEEMTQKFGGTQAAPESVTVTSDASVSPDPAATGWVKPEGVMSHTEVAEMLRRMMGSRDASKMLYGSGGDTLPRADAAEAIKRLAPGPSRIPLTAEARINGSPRELTLEDALRQIIESRGTPDE